MAIPVPAAKRPLKLEITAKQIADLDVIAARHYEAHITDYEAAKEPKPTAADVAAALLDDAIIRELRPARSNRKNGKG